MSVIGDLTSRLTGWFSRKGSIKPPSPVEKGSKEAPTGQGDEQTNRRRTIDISDRAREAQRIGVVPPEEKDTYDRPKPKDP